MKINNNSHEFPKSPSSLASVDFWYKEPLKKKKEKVVDGEEGVRGKVGGQRKRDDENQISNRKTNSTNETATNPWARAMTQGCDRSWFSPPPCRICSCCIEMNEGKTGGEHGGSLRKRHDPSSGLSASAAAGQMLAGEGNGGADKVRAPAESIEPTALHLSLEGGWRR